MSFLSIHLMTGTEAAEYLGISTKRLRAMAKAGRCPSTVIGCRRYYSREQLARWIEAGGAQPREQV
jgi:excisionase family DNA binding protein